MCYGTGKYTVCRRVRPSFSPEILQARAVNCAVFSMRLFFRMGFMPARYWSTRHVFRWSFWDDIVGLTECVNPATALTNFCRQVLQTQK